MRYHSREIGAHFFFVVIGPLGRNKHGHDNKCRYGAQKKSHRYIQKSHENLLLKVVSSGNDLPRGFFILDYYTWQYRKIKLIFFHCWNIRPTSTILSIKNRMIVKLKYLTLGNNFIFTSN